MYLSVRVSILPLSTFFSIFLLNISSVPTMWYFFVFHYIHNAYEKSEDAKVVIKCITSMKNRTKTNNGGQNVTQKIKD
jgi:hypothetical protein